MWILGVTLQVFTQMLWRKPQRRKERVHFLQSAWTPANFFDILSQIVGDVSQKGSLERNLYLLLLRCVAARRKETTQLLKCYSGMCLGVLVPHRCLKRAAMCSVLAKRSAFWHIQEQHFRYAALCFNSRTAEGLPFTGSACLFTSAHARLHCGHSFVWSPSWESLQPCAVHFEPTFSAAVAETVTLFNV